MANDLSSETAPAELHLSDCALTSDGFNLLMNAIEEKELYPTSIVRGRSLPLYLRLENNYIDEAVMQEKIDAGIIRRYKKAPGAQQEAGPGVKVNLVVNRDSGLQQKTGLPPSIEEAAPPKEVYDRSSGKGWSSGWNNKGSKGSSKGGQQWNNNSQWNARPQTVRANPSHLGSILGAMARPALGAPVRPGVVRPQGAVVRPVTTWNNNVQKTGGKGVWP